MNCQDNSRLKVPLPELCKTTDIGCVPITDGKPDCPPEADQLPLAYDPNAQTLWVFSCESRKWVPLTRFSLAELEEVSVDNFRNICDLLKVPVFYNPGQGTIEGHMSLGELAKKIVECGDIKNTTTIIQEGDNVEIVTNQQGDTITYVINSTGGGVEDSKTILQAGNNIQLSSTQNGATTTYTINAVTPTIVDQNDITKLEAGDNVTLTSDTIGNTTTYRVSSTGAGPGDSKTILEAGDNITLVPTVNGATTTYKISSTGAGPGDSKTIIQAGDNISYTTITEGATTTYTLNAGETVVEAGDNVSVTKTEAGNTTTYKVSSTGAGPQDSKTILEAGEGIKLVPTVNGATTTYKISSTVDGADGNNITVVEAGDNVTVTPTTVGNTTTYKISATGGGPNDSKTIIQEGDNITYTTVQEGDTIIYKLDAKNDITKVEAGTGISVTSSKDGDVTTYTVSSTGGGGSGGDGNDITKIVAGDNVTLTTSTSGNTTTYTIGSTGGGPEDSKAIVVGGDGISVVPTVNGATTTYTVTATGSGGGGGGVIFGGDDASGKGNVPHHNAVNYLSNIINPGIGNVPRNHVYFSRNRSARWINSYNLSESFYNIPNEYARYTVPWYLEIELVNPYDSPATGVVELNAAFLISGITNSTTITANNIVPNANMYCVFSITDDLDVSILDIAQGYDITNLSASPNPMFKGTNWGILKGKSNSHIHWTEINDGGTPSDGSDDTYTPRIDALYDVNYTEKLQVARYVSELAANETKKVYLQYYVYGLVTVVIGGSSTSISPTQSIAAYGPESVSWIVTAHYNSGVYPK